MVNVLIFRLMFNLAVTMPNYAESITNVCYTKVANFFLWLVTKIPEMTTAFLQ